MKRYQKWFATLVMALAIVTGFSVSKLRAQPGAYISYQTFYDDLSPYGEWISDPQYGYVWVPDVDQNFQPYYTEGRWVMTEYGNTWVSDYSWGWAPFHYGRWTYDEYYGWVWIPDTQWGPAWVSWRSGGGYYGWAPLGPGITISASWGGYNAPYDWWVFIPCGNIYSHDYYNYYRGPRYNQTYIRNTTVINHTNNYNHVTYTTGPRVNEVRNYIKQPVRVYNIKNQPRASATVVANNSVNIFRPQVRNSGGGRPAPHDAIRPDRRIGAPKPISVNNGHPQGAQELRGQRNNPRPGRSETPAQTPNVRQQPAVRPGRPEPGRTQPAQMPRQQPQQEPRQTPVQQQPRVEPQREPRQMPVQQQPRVEPQRQPRQQPQREERPQPMQQQREPRPMPAQQPARAPQNERRQAPAPAPAPRMERPQQAPQQAPPPNREHGRR